MRSVSLFRHPGGPTLGFDFAFRRDLERVNVVCPRTYAVPTVQRRADLMQLPLLTGEMTTEGAASRPDDPTVTVLVAFESPGAASEASDRARRGGAPSPHAPVPAVTDIAIDLDEARMVGGLMGLPVLVLLEGSEAMFFPAPRGPEAPPNEFS